MRIIKFFNCKWLILAIVTTIFIMFLTHLPQRVVPQKLEENSLDKFQHIVAYGIITLFYALSIRHSFSLLPAMVLFFTISIIATLDEFTQQFFHRQTSPIDWLADMIGVTVIVFSFFFIRNFKSQFFENLEI